MDIGDKVIINPNIPSGTWSKYHYSFHDDMRRPGVFTLDKESCHGGFQIGDYVYDEEWLLPVPLFKEGDIVKIREDLSKHIDVPYGISQEMEYYAGKSLTVAEVISRDRDSSITMLGDDGYLYHLDDDGWSWSSPMFDLSNYKLKNKSNESRLQKQESPLRGGSREVKCGVCCRKHKPRVTIQPVGYKKVIGRG